MLALPFSTQIPDSVVLHTFVQPINCLILLPGPGDTSKESGTSGWREGASTLPLPVLVPKPGCLPGSEPATCPHTRPAGRKFTPASTSGTGRKSSAGPETPPLVHLLAVGPCYLTVSDHELRASPSDGLDTPSLEPLLSLGHWKRTQREATPLHALAPTMHPRARKKPEAADQERTPTAAPRDHVRSPTPTAAEATGCGETSKDGRDDREECAREAFQTSRQQFSSLRSNASSLIPASPRQAVACRARPHLATTVPLEPG